MSNAYTHLYMYILSLVLKARHLGGCAYCDFLRLGVPEQAVGGTLLGCGIVVEDKPSFVYTGQHYHEYTDTTPAVTTCEHF